MASVPGSTIHSFRCQPGNTLVQFESISLTSRNILPVCFPPPSKPTDLRSTFLTLLEQESRSRSPTSFPGILNTWHPILSLSLVVTSTTLSLLLTIRHAIVVTSIIRGFTIIVAKNTSVEQRRYSRHFDSPVETVNILLHDSSRNINCRLPCRSRLHKPTSTYLIQNTTVPNAQSFEAHSAKCPLILRHSLPITCIQPPV